MNSDQYLKKNDQDLNGQNLIKKPVKRDLTRVGVVDIGSNSVRLVVFDGAGRAAVPIAVPQAEQRGRRRVAVEELGEEVGEEAPRLEV